MPDLKVEYKRDMRLFHTLRRKLDIFMPRERIAKNRLFGNRIGEFIHCLMDFYDDDDGDKPRVSYIRKKLPESKQVESRGNRMNRAKARIEGKG